MDGDSWRAAVHEVKRGRQDRMTNSFTRSKPLQAELFSLFPPRHVKTGKGGQKMKESQSSSH